MGSFYTNYTLRRPSQQAVAAALAGRSAIVTPAEDGCVVVFDEQSDEQDRAVHGACLAKAALASGERLSLDGRVSGVPFGRRS